MIDGWLWRNIFTIQSVPVSPLLIEENNAMSEISCQSFSSQWVSNTFTWCHWTIKLRFLNNWNASFCCAIKYVQIEQYKIKGPTPIFRVHFALIIITRERYYYFVLLPHIFYLRRHQHVFKNYPISCEKRNSVKISIRLLILAIITPSPCLGLKHNTCLVPMFSTYRY